MLVAVLVMALEGVIEHALQRRETQVNTNKLRPRITASCTQISISTSARTPRGGAPGMMPRDEQNFATPRGEPRNLFPVLLAVTALIIVIVICAI